MALIEAVRGIYPVFGKDCFIAANATVIGDVTIGDECSVWFGAVVRGDVNSIRTGNRVNIQDGAVLHCTYEKTTIETGNNVTIGHNVVLHGAIIGSNVLIGMGAVIMDGCKIGDNSVIAAGAVLLEGTVVEPGSVYAGVPARAVKEGREAELSKMAEKSASGYREYMRWYMER